MEGFVWTCMTQGCIGPQNSDCYWGLFGILRLYRTEDDNLKPTAKRPTKKKSARSAHFVQTTSFIDLESLDHAQSCVVSCAFFFESLIKLLDLSSRGRWALKGWDIFVQERTPMVARRNLFQPWRGRPERNCWEICWLLANFNHF